LNPVKAWHNGQISDEAGREPYTVAYTRPLSRTSEQLVARTGGDEFAIIVEDTTGEHDVAMLAENILEAIAAPIIVGDRELTVTTSIGAVERPVANTNPTALLQAANATLRRAKGNGKGRYAIFDQLTGGDFGRT
jgi:diguanylate cyclase (GGDEF)-like protein